MTTKISPAIIEKLSNAINTSVELKQAIQVHGGDINETFRSITTAGDYFIKTNSHAANDMFEKEWNGLRLLQSANALKVPEVIVYGRDAGTDFLIMDFIEKGEAKKGFWKMFADGLAKQHQCSISFDTKSI